MPWHLQRFVAVHCGVHCTVHCACTVRALYVHCAKHSLCNSASGGVEAHSLFVGSSCEDERVFGLGLCAPIASELPYACRPQLPTVFRARPTVISRLRFICFLVASELWSSKCLFYLFPWPLYVSPCALCCPARRMSLFTCLPSCVSWCAYTSVRLFTCPLFYSNAESRWVSISRSWGGIAASH